VEERKAGEEKKKKRKRKPTVVELEQQAEQKLREQIEEMDVPEGALARLMDAMMGTAKIVTTSKRIEDRRRKMAGQETTTARCLQELDCEGMLNKEGQTFAAVARHPSVYSWRQLIEMVLQPKGEGVGIRRRHAREFVKNTWKVSMEQFKAAVQHAMGTAEGVEFQKRATEVLGRTTAPTAGTNYVKWVWNEALKGEAGERLQNAVAEGLVFDLTKGDTWLPRREGEEQQRVASVCWPKTRETGIRPKRPEQECNAVTGQVGDDKVEVEVVTLNINSIRQAIADGSLMAYIRSTTADFYCLQETMVGIDSKDWRVTAFLRELQGIGYFWYLNAATRNKGGYGGTAIITKHQPDLVHLGLGNASVDREGRFMALVYDKWVIINSYVPTLQLDLSGGERKELFCSTMTDKVKEMRQKHKTKRFLWAGDINVCRLEKDHTTFNPEFPGCSPAERQRLEKMLEELGMEDTMPEEQEGEDRYSYYDRRSDSNNAWRLDYIFMDKQREGAVAAKVMGAKPVTEGGPKSDHLAVSATIEVDEPITAQSYVVVKQAKKQIVNARVLVHDGCEGARPGRPLPATVVALAGDLLRVRIDQRWLLPCTPAHAGVSSHDVTLMTHCPPRWEKGEEVEHKRSGKTGEILYLEENDKEQTSTDSGKQMYVVRFRGDKTARRCAEDKLRATSVRIGEKAIAALGNEQALRVARAVAKATKGRGTGEEDSPSCGCDPHGGCATNCGIGSTEPETIGEDKTEGEGTHRDGTREHKCCSGETDQGKTVCQCGEQDGSMPNNEETNNQGPSVPMMQLRHQRRTRGEQQWYTANVLVDSGAFTSIVSLAWLKKTYPHSWNDMINTAGAARTKFSLADGSRATSPRGKARLDFELGEETLKLSERFWVLEGLAHDVILGSNFLDSMGTTISYGKRSLIFDARPKMKPLPFKMSDRNKYWRRPARVRLKVQVTLQPGETQTIPVEVDREDLACLDKEERKFGTLHTEGKTLSWEVGAKAQCLAVGENTNATVSLTNHTTKVIKIEKQEVVAAFMPIDRKSVHVLGGQEDQIVRREEAKKSGRMAIAPPVRTVWKAEEYKTMADKLMEDKNAAGVVLMDVDPQERIWDIWRKLEEALAAIGDGRLPEKLGTLVTGPKKEKMVARRTFRAAGITKPTVMCFRWVSHDNGLEAALQRQEVHIDQLDRKAAQGKSKGTQGTQTKCIRPGLRIVQRKKRGKNKKAEIEEAMVKQTPAKQQQDKTKIGRSTYEALSLERQTTGGNKIEINALTGVMTCGDQSSVATNDETCCGKRKDMSAESKTSIEDMSRIEKGSLAVTSSHNRREVTHETTWAEKRRLRLVSGSVNNLTTTGQERTGQATGARQDAKTCSCLVGELKANRDKPKQLATRRQIDSEERATLSHCCRKMIQAAVNVTIPRPALSGEPRDEPSGAQESGGAHSDEMEDVTCRQPEAPQKTGYVVWDPGERRMGRGPQYASAGVNDEVLKEEAKRRRKLAKKMQRRRKQKEQRQRGINIIGIEPEHTGDLVEEPPPVDMTDEQVEEELRTGVLKGLDLQGSVAKPESIAALKRMLIRYKRIFDLSKKGTRVKGYDARVEIKPGARPTQAKVYSLGPEMDKATREWVRKMIADDSIEPSRAPWRAGVVCVPKGGGWRVCLDGRVLNKVVKPVSWVMPSVGDALDSIAGADHYSTVDLKQAYHQIGIREEDRDPLTFCTVLGCFRFKCLPFGLHTASAIFQKFIDLVVGEMRYKTSDTIRREREMGENEIPEEDTTERPGCAMPYVDDIALHTVGGEDKHLRDLDMLLGRLHAFDCRLSASKCKFFHKKIEFLGHLVSKDGLEADPKKVAAVEAITVDRMKKPKDLKVFLHTVGYMRKFIKNFAARAAPMSKYLKKGAKMKPALENDEEARKAFLDLRACLLTPPILAHPDWSKPFEVHCDGSKQGLGAALIQRGDGGEARVVMYASRTLRGGTTKNPQGGERSYAIYELESLAVLFALDTFRKYILGKRTKVFSDHIALSRLTMKAVGRVNRWVERLMEYDVEIIHAPGRLHGLPDGLSRFPVQGENQYVQHSEVPLLSSIQKSKWNWKPAELVRALHGEAIEWQNNNKKKKTPQCTGLCKGYCGIAGLHESQPGAKRTRRVRQQRNRYVPGAGYSTVRMTQEEKEFVNGKAEMEEPEEGKTGQQSGSSNTGKNAKSKSSSSSSSSYIPRTSQPDPAIAPGQNQVQVRNDEESENSNLFSQEASQPRNEDQEYESITYPPEPAAKLTRETFKEHQQQDEKCIEIREVLEAELPDKADERIKATKIKQYFYVEEGLLMRRAFVEQPDEQLEAQQDEEEQDEQDEQEEQDEQDEQDEQKEQEEQQEDNQPEGDLISHG